MGYTTLRVTQLARRGNGTLYASTEKEFTLTEEDAVILEARLQEVVEEHLIICSEVKPRNIWTVEEILTQFEV